MDERMDGGPMAAATDGWRSTGGEPSPARGGDYAGFALVPSRDYFPGQPFTVVARLESSTTIDLLDGPADRPLPVLPRPDEYYGYVVQYLRFGTPVYGLVFTRELLRTGAGYRFAGQVTVFDATLNLLATPFEPIDDAP